MAQPTPVPLPPSVLPQYRALCDVMARMLAAAWRAQQAEKAKEEQAS